MRSSILVNSTVYSYGSKIDSHRHLLPYLDGATADSLDGFTQTYGPALDGVAAAELVPQDPKTPPQTAETVNHQPRQRLEDIRIPVGCPHHRRRYLRHDVALEILANFGGNESRRLLEFQMWKDRFPAQNRAWARDGQIRFFAPSHCVQSR